ncbi:MAG: hypothetical protein AAF382_03800, partial [Pseudomonadota bacterium]
MRGLLRKIKRRDVVLSEQARPEYLNIMLRGGRMTKVAGVAASFAPTLGTVGSTLTLGASSIALGTALSVSGAFAGNCGALGGGAYVCIGPANNAVDVTQSFIVPGDLNVALADGFGIDTTGGGNAFQLGNDPAGTSITLTDIYGAAITGGNNGIVANNANAASTDVTIDLAGTVRGVVGNGITVTNFGTGLTTINNTNAAGTASVTGQLTGIYAYAGFNTTGIEIAVNNVTSYVAEGIQARSNGGGDITVNATNAAGTALVSASQVGIRVGHYGAASGTVSITANNVSAVDNDGIYVYHSDGDDILVTVDGEVESDTAYGIRTNHFGFGDTVITATNAAGDASVRGYASGIRAYADNTTGAMTITTNNVTGYTGDGIYGQSFGSGDLTITSTNAAGTADVFGQVRGIAARNYDAGALTITADNVYSIVGAGIDAYNNGGTTDLNITVNQEVFSTGSTGIRARNYGTGDTIINTANAAGDGNVFGDSDGIYAYSDGSTGALTITTNTVTSQSSSGIRARHYGTGDLTINATNAAGTSAVTAQNAGIYAFVGGPGALSVTANNVTATNGQGIRAYSLGSGDITVTADGQVQSTNGDGIYLGHFGTGNSTIDVTNAAGDALVSGSRGVYVYAGLATGTTSLTFNNVTGTGNDAINVRSSGNGGVTVTSGNVAGTAQVTGDASGITARNYDGDLAISANNVTGTNSYGIYAYSDGVDIDVTTTGTIYGNTSGIYARNSGTGDTTITTTNAAGDATVTGGNNGIRVYQNFGSDAVTITANNVNGYAGYGIYVRSFGDGDTNVTATNATGTATVFGADFGIYVYNAYGDVNITADDVTGSNDDGIAVYNGPFSDAVSVTAYGTVLGDDEGIYVRNSGTGGVTVSASNASGTGQVTSLNDNGVEIDNYNGGAVDVTVDNVTAPNYGVLIYNDAAGTGVSLTVNGTVQGDYNAVYIVNNGSEGVTVSATNADNSSLLTGDYGLYVTNYNGGAVDVIVDSATGLTGDAIDLENDSAGTTISLTAYGTITGYEYGIDIDNYGTGGVTLTATNADGTALVTSLDGNAIGVNNENGGAVVITVDNVTGYDYGIVTQNDASGSTVTVTGTGTIQTVNSDAIEINSDGTGGVLVDVRNADGTAEVTTQNGHGIDIFNDNGGAVRIYADNVSGSEEAIEIDNDPGGLFVSVTINGDVTAGNQEGIDIDNQGVGGITVTATNADNSSQITALNNEGVLVDNDNGGAVSVTVDNVTAYNEGIEVDNDNVGTSVSVTVYGYVVSYEDEGIDVDNNGSEGVTVTASNADRSVQITSLDEEGLNVNNDEGGGVTITADNVTAEEEGIEIDNDTSSTYTRLTVYGSVLSYDNDGIEIDSDGTGDVTVSVSNADGTAQVTSETNEGIDLDNDNGGSVDVTVDNAYGYSRGMYIRNDAAGTSVSVTVNGNVTGTNNEGIDIENDGSEGVSVVATNATNSSQITGYENAVNVLNYNGGAVDITVDNATSADAIGVYAYNDTAGTDLSVTSYGNVTGDFVGIYAENDGSGDLNITASNPDGTAITTGFGGIVARNFNGGTVTIVADNATGQLDAIYGLNDVGGTTLSVRTYGDVISDTYGIRGYNYGTGDFTIVAQNSDSSAQVTGGEDGITATNYNGGALSITADNATGTVNDAITAYNDAAGTDLTITALGDVIGGDEGIDAVNEGSGDLLVQATNTAGTANVTGGDNGISVDNFNGGSVIVFADNVTGTADAGISTTNDPAGTNTSITTYGDVSGATNGIEAFHGGSGLLSVTVSGGVDSSGGYGIYTFAGPAGTTRITLEDGADVTGSVNAIFNDAGDSDSYFNDGSTVSQGVVLNDGSDNLTIANADITAVTVLDGGDDSDVADGFVDLLTFSGFDGSFGADLLNWEGVIFDESNATFTGAAITTP